VLALVWTGVGFDDVEGRHRVRTGLVHTRLSERRIERGARIQRHAVEGDEV
jgi:hypothetical protein